MIDPDAIDYYNRVQKLNQSQTEGPARGDSAFKDTDASGCSKPKARPFVLPKAPPLQEIRSIRELKIAENNRRLSKTVEQSDSTGTQCWKKIGFLFEKSKNRIFFHLIRIFLKFKSKSPTVLV